MQSAWWHKQTTKQLNMQRKIKDTVICLQMGKTYTAKIQPGDF